MANAFSLLAGQVFNTVAGALSNSAGVEQSYATQKQLMNDQAKINYKYYKKELQNRWRLTRQGLVNGDFNPMLAAIGNITGNSQWASPQTTSDLNFGATINGANANSIQSRAVESQTLLNEAQAQNYNADTEKKDVESGNLMLERGRIQAETQLKEAEKVLADKRSSNYERELAIAERRNSIEYLKANQQYAVAKQQNQIANYNAETQRLNYETYRQQMEIEKETLLRYNKWAKDHPYAASIGETISRSINGNVGVSFGKRFK